MRTASLEPARFPLATKANFVSIPFKNRKPRHRREMGIARCERHITLQSRRRNPQVIFWDWPSQLLDFCSGLGVNQRCATVGIQHRDDSKQIADKCKVFLPTS